MGKYRVQFTRPRTRRRWELSAQGRRRRVLELSRDQRWGTARIAADLGVSTSTVRRIMREIQKRGIELERGVRGPRRQTIRLMSLSDVFEV